MPRDFSEPWEPEDVFDRLAAQERRERMAAAEERNRQLLELEARQTAEQRERAAALTDRANKSIAAAEFAARGLRPPFTDGRGAPTVSLGLLLWAGWTVQALGAGQNVLLEPPPRKVEPPARDWVRDGSS